MPADSQTPKIYKYQVSKQFWKKKKKISRKVVAILIIGGKLEI